ncbi:hypothetical protein DFH08DRAFT_1084654 [Mycena albidolilacea]|uniref:Uncharacterized protein n=1 Tax=Mycena albidolilacea TaxID=1033008 RepID=A0AAD6ZM49_9AGAR|nr:hypothetical protein DFH08DRAFT_1084654 [Mycena albidolilacea]
MTSVLTNTPSSSLAAPPLLPPLLRTAHIILELLFCGTAAFLLTSRLLPLFGLQACVWTVLRVTALCTLAVFALFEAFRGRRSSPHCDLCPTPNENPEFKLDPQRWRSREEARWGDKRGVGAV